MCAKKLGNWCSYGIKDEIKPRTYVTSYGDLPTPTRNGYNFDGWHTAASGGNKVTKDTKVTATADHTLYAHWTAIPKATYAITYVSNGGSGTMPKGAATEGIPFTLPACGFTKPSGKEFKAWSIDGKEYAPGASYTFTGNATVTAVWQANISVNPDEAQILIENQTVSFGSTFTVPVLLKNNPGVIGFSFAVEYDAEKLEYVSAADADFTGIAANVNVDGNQLGFAFSSASKTNLTGETIVKLTFRAKSGAEGTASLAFVIDEAFGDGFSAFNSDTQENEPVSVSIKDAEISIADFIPGDVNGSGRVDNEDLILLTRYRARWKVSINMDAADVDGNGKVDNEDLIRLTRYRARWKVTLLPGKVSAA